MKINEYSPVAKSGVTSRKKEASASSGGGGFLGLLSASEVETATPSAPAADVIPTTSMNALLSLQEMPEDEIARRRAYEDSRETIEALETLRIGLLTGSIPDHLMHTLADVVAQQKQKVNDPRLMSLIEDIELRAAVELAKLERAQRQET